MTASGYDLNFYKIKFSSRNLPVIKIKMTHKTSRLEVFYKYWMLLNSYEIHFHHLITAIIKIKMTHKTSRLEVFL